MSKVLLSFKRNTYVVDDDVGVKVMELLANSEVYMTKYAPDNKSTHHIFSPSMKDILYGEVTVKSLPTHLYKLAKIAGEPE